MKNLQAKQIKELQKHTQSINNFIEHKQSQKLYEFMIVNMPYVDDFRISYRSNRDNLKEAESLGDIFLAGVLDVVSIIATDALGIKNYQLIENEDVALVKLGEHLEEEYPFFLEFETQDTIQDTLQKLESDKETDTLYYKELQILMSKIDNIYKVHGKIHKIKNYVRALEWKFIKINLAIGLAQIKEIPTYKDVERLEEEARVICRKLAKGVKKYEKRIKKLELLDTKALK